MFTGSILYLSCGSDIESCVFYVSLCCCPEYSVLELLHLQWIQHDLCYIIGKANIHAVVVGSFEVSCVEYEESRA